MTCQRCGQAEAEWKVKEMLADGGRVVRWWHLCDVCVLEDFGPWIGRKIPAVAEGCLWASRDQRQYRKAVSPPSEHPASTSTRPSSPKTSDGLSIATTTTSATSAKPSPKQDVADLW